MKAAVIGCGAWGTALANCLCKNGFDTVLWCHDAALAQEMRQKGLNPMLEGVPLNGSLQTSAEADCVENCDLVVIATSSVFVRSSSRMIAPHLGENTVVATVVKGVESGTMLRMSQIVAEETGMVKPSAVYLQVCDPQKVAAVRRGVREMLDAWDQ